MKGKVIFIGAGPGDPDLITVKGRKVIEKADVIIYAGSLVNPDVLSPAREDCEIHNSAYLNLDETDEYAQEVALIIEEILKQRIQGIKNEKGIYTTPTFPKLVYVLHEHNCLEGGKYDYITELAVECSSKRLYPDYISAKEMRKIYEGNVFSPMGQGTAHVKPCELLCA